MKNWLMLAGIAGIAITSGIALAQSGMGVGVVAPDNADVTITEQQMEVPMNNGGYNNSDMKPLPYDPAVEVESVSDAMAPQMQTETDVNIQESEPGLEVIPNGNNLMQSDTMINE